MSRAGSPIPGSPRRGVFAGLTVALAAVAVLSTACGGGKSTSGADSARGTSTTAAPTTVVAGPPPGSELFPLLDLDTGNCFDTVADQTSVDQAAWKINCADPHTYEVYDLVGWDGDGSGRGMPYPGTEAVQKWAENACYSQFEQFVGVRWTISDLDIKVWWPSERSWNNNDRGVLCTVMASDGSRLTGTQRGVAH